MVSTRARSQKAPAVLPRRQAHLLERQEELVLHVLAVPSEPNFDCIAVRRGRDVVLLVADTLLSPRGAAAMTAALALALRDAPARIG